jgi:hypothetical protein
MISLIAARAEVILAEQGLGLAADQDVYFSALLQAERELYGEAA